MSTGDEILAKADATFLSLIRNSAVGLVRSGVQSTDPLADAQAMDALAMEEPAAAFDYDMPGAASGESRKITRADIEELVIAISQRYPLLLPEKVAEIKASLLVNIGVSKSNFSEIEVQAMNMARAASAERSDAQQPTTPEQKIEQLLNRGDERLSNMYRDMKDAIDKYATDEEQEELGALRKRRAEAKTPKEKLAAQEAEQTFYKETIPKWSKRAKDVGDGEAVRLFDKNEVEAEAGLKDAKDVDELMAEFKARKEKVASASDAWERDDKKTVQQRKGLSDADWLASPKDGLGLTDEDWAKPLASNDQGKNVTLDDVESQSVGQKQKSTTKTLT